jgi:hypothetical protein
VILRQHVQVIKTNVAEKELVSSTHVQLESRKIWKLGKCTLSLANMTRKRIQHVVNIGNVLILKGNAVLLAILMNNRALRNLEIIPLPGLLNKTHLKWKE